MTDSNNMTPMDHRGRRWTTLMHVAKGDPSNEETVRTGVELSWHFTTQIFKPGSSTIAATCGNTAKKCVNAGNAIKLESKLSFYGMLVKNISDLKDRKVVWTTNQNRWRLMFSLSHTTGYAILALSCLHEAENERVLAKDIAARIKLPLPYLSKILYRLRLRGMICGKRGYRGGFVLARPPTEISLLQIADAIEGPEWLPQCMLGLENCPSSKLCPTRGFWKIERSRIHRKLERTTLVDVTRYVRRWNKPNCGCRSC